jgi:hypothetical protein
LITASQQRQLALLNMDAPSLGAAATAGMPLLLSGRPRPAADSLEERLKSEAIANIEAFLLVPGKNALFPSFKRVSWFDDGELP